MLRSIVSYLRRPPAVRTSQIKFLHGVMVLGWDVVSRSHPSTGSNAERVDSISATPERSRRRTIWQLTDRYQVLFPPAVEIFKCLNEWSVTILFLR